jgi:hypothetical protein
MPLLSATIIVSAKNSVFYPACELQDTGRDRRLESVSKFSKAHKSCHDSPSEWGQTYVSALIWADSQVRDIRFGTYYKTCLSMTSLDASSSFSSMSAYCSIIHTNSKCMFICNENKKIHLRKRIVPLCKMRRACRNSAFENL